MDQPKVSIITRTRDREVFLSRAAASVLGQRGAPAWEWIVVNDAGDPQAVEAALLEPLRRHPGRIRLHHLAVSQGMEHASNCGIARSAGEYLVIHDDDDAWDPDFLRVMTGFLDDPGNRGYAGAVCRSVRIVEEMVDGRPVERLRHPFNPELQALSFWDVLQENRFPPISFLLRRSLYAAVGPFNEDLPVLGDWEFNLRALARHPLAVVPEPLACYHHRSATTVAAHANSITGGDAHHRETEARLRREWASRNPFGVPGEILASAAPVAGHLHRMKVSLAHLIRRAAALRRPPPPQF